mgnify:CR=1 FL=1
MTDQASATPNTSEDLVSFVNEHHRRCDRHDSLTKAIARIESMLARDTR